MKRIYLSLLLFLLCLPRIVFAADKPLPPYKSGVLLPYVFISSDSESFRTQKAGVGVYPRYVHGDSYIGVKAISDRYSQNNWDSKGAHYSLVARDITPQTGLGYHFDVGGSYQGGHTLLTTDSNWSHQWRQNTSTDLFISRDWVETQNALTGGISHTFAGAGVQQKLTPRLTVVGLAAGQLFSDGNVRQHGRARLIYDLFPQHGVNLQGRFRAFHSNASDVDNNYFNPKHYTEEMMAIGLRRNIAGWALNATAGLGMQHVDSASATSTKLLELGVASPAAGKVFLRANTGYSEAASFNGPNYNYGYLQAQLVFAY